MKKVFKIIGIVLLFVLFIFLTNVVLGYIIVGYSNNTSEYYYNLVDDIVLKEDINVVHKDADDYIIFNNLKIRNDFSDFEKEVDEESNTLFYELKDVKNRRFVSFSISLSDDSINASYTSDFIEKYDIKNDIDYIRVLKEYDFQGVHKMLENEDAIMGAESYSRDGISYNIIKGDLQGLIENEEFSMKKFIYLYDDNQTYLLMFNGLGYFTDVQIYDLISTIVIE